MKSLYVMYDARCGLCTEVRDWLKAQPAYLDLQVMASDSDEARWKFPGLPAGELAVVSDKGEVWLGNHAFIMCLWALRGYRNWARRLSSPMLRPVARQAFEAVSRNRRNVSALLGLKSETELKESLNEVTIPPCQTP
jgi:predicted DCC family thiol-disulfide oxidoreductase YuxK